MNDNSPTQPLALELQLHAMPALLTVLTTVARLGAMASVVEAIDGRVRLVVETPIHVAHRVPVLLRELVEVMSVREVALPAEFINWQRWSKS